MTIRFLFRRLVHITYTLPAAIVSFIVRWIKEDPDAEYMFRRAFK